MRKTLATLMALGSLALGNAGCTMTPEGNAFVRQTFIGAAQSGANSYASERARVAANPANAVPPQTNVYVQNPGQKLTLNTPTEEEGYWIDKDLLDGTEEDLKEAKAVYKVLILEETYHSQGYRGKEYSKKIDSIDLEGCSENFKKIFKGYVREDETKIRWNIVLEEAVKEGVRER